MSKANVFDSFFNPRIEFTAVDLSDNTVKLARVRRKRKKREVVGILNAALPKGVVVGGRVQDTEGLARALRAIFAKSEARKLKTSFAAMSLPEEHCFVRIVRVPRLPKGELETAIRWEAEAAIPMAPDEAVISGEVLEGEGGPDHVDALVVGVPRDLVEPYVEAMAAVPMVAVAVEPESFAIARALLRPEDEEPVLLIDLGHEHTGVIIAQAGIVRVTANVPVAARMFTESIAAARKIPYEQAEKLKREVGMGSEGEGPAIREALKPVLSEVVLQIQQFFGFFETHAHVHVGHGAPQQVRQAAVSIRRVLLTGGDALLLGLPEYLQEALHVPVAVGDPFRNVQPASKQLRRHPLFTTVIGLAQYEVDLSTF